MIRFSIEIKHLYKLENLSNIINVFTGYFDQLNASLFSATSEGGWGLVDAWIFWFLTYAHTCAVFYPFTLSCHDLDSWSRTTLTLPTKDHFMFLVKQSLHSHLATRGHFFRHFARHAWRKKKVSVWYCISVLAGKTHNLIVLIDSRQSTQFVRCKITITRLCQWVWGRLVGFTVLSCVTFLDRLLCKTENIVAWSHICACEIPLCSKGRHDIVWPHTRWLTFPALIPSQLSELFLVVHCSLTTTRLWAQCLTLLPHNHQKAFYEIPYCWYYSLLLACAVCVIAATFSVVFSSVKIPHVNWVIDITILSQLIYYNKYWRCYSIRIYRKIFKYANEALSN